MAETSVTSQTETQALLREYDSMQAHHLEYAKLQIQVVGLSFAGAGALWAVSNNTTRLLSPAMLLLASPFFAAIALIWLHLQLSCRVYRRHVRFVVRPRIEAIIRTEGGVAPDVGVWSWEDSYTSDARLVSLVTRLVGGLRGISAWLPAGLTIAAFFVIEPRPSPLETRLLIFAAVIAGATAFVIALAIVLDERWWRRQERELRRHSVARRVR